MNLDFSKITRSLFQSLLVCSLCFCAAPRDAYAKPSAKKQARATISELRQKIKELRGLLNKPGVRQALSAYSGNHPDLTDSDSDGLPDVIENAEGTDSCNEDSDGDGIHDGDEESGGSDPGDASESEVEVTDTISAKTETTVTVGGYTFTVTDTTDFRDGNSLADYTVGQLVEAQGRIVESVLTLKKIKLED